MSLTDRALLRYCPELRMIDEPRQLEAVLQRIRGKPSLATRRLRLAITTGLVVLLIILILRGPLNVTMWYLPGLPFFLFGYLPTSAGFMLAPFSRSRTRLEVREHMAREAFPICIPCGHDLRGTPGPYCPECGAVTTYRSYAQQRGTPPTHPRSPQ